MAGKTLFFFSEAVDDDTLDNIMSKGQKTVIQELEMMAVLAAVKSWRSFLKSRRVVLFTDSKSVRGSFLKTWSANEDSDDMICVIFRVDEEFDIPLWIERVASQSNPSDVLSREVVSNFEGADEPVGNLEVAGQVIQLWWSPQSRERGRKRGCGHEYHRKFPIFKKEKRVRLPARVHSSWSVAHKLHGS